jgi:hypothetical protein
MIIEAKQGSTFSLDAKAVKNDDTPYDLTGFTITSLITGAGVNKLLTVGYGISLTNLALGEYRLDVSLDGFSAATYNMDVKYTNGTIVDYSVTHTIKVNRAITK